MASPRFSSFAIITLLITSVLLFLYTRSLRGTLSPLLCSIIAVIWQLGLLTTLGYGLNAYSILIPFLVFAIGVSHGVQIVNAFLGESIAGHDRQASARRAFRALYIPGMTALVSDAIGFITMVLIPIQVIKDLGIAASIGVAVVVLTNLVLLPIMMSYIGITKKTLEHHRKGRSNDVVRETAWRLLAHLASARVARISILVAAVGFALGIYGGQNLKIGDLDPGAPELHPDSRYNLDNQYITDNYATSSDILVVMVETSEEACAQYENLELVDRFTWHMQNVPGVSSAMAPAEVSKLYAAGYNEGNLKWATINRDQRLLGSTFDQMPGALMNTTCSLLPVALFLTDHKAETLQRVVDAAQAFAQQNRQEGIHFALAAGNAGIEAATNQEIATAQNTDDAADLRRSECAGASQFCLLARRGLHSGAAGTDLLSGPGADGLSGHRRESGDTARYRTGRRSGCRLRHLYLQQTDFLPAPWHGNSGGVL